MKLPALIIGILLLVGEGNASAQSCSVEQRIKLSEAGYEKSEIEELCAQDSSTGSAPVGPASVSPLDVLRNTMSYTAEGKRMYWFNEAQKCGFLEDGIKLDNVSNGFGGYKSVVHPYKDFYTQARKRGMQYLNVDAAKGEIMSYIVVRLGGIKNPCTAFSVYEQNLSPEELATSEAAVRLEFDSVLKALKAMGVKVE